MEQKNNSLVQGPATGAQATAQATATGATATAQATGSVAAVGGVMTEGRVTFLEDLIKFRGAETRLKLARVEETSQRRLMEMRQEMNLYESKVRAHLRPLLNDHMALWRFEKRLAESGATKGEVMPEQLILATVMHLKALTAADTTGRQLDRNRVTTTANQIDIFLQRYAEEQERKAAAKALTEQGLARWREAMAQFS